MQWAAASQYESTRWKADHHSWEQCHMVQRLMYRAYTQTPHYVGGMEWGEKEKGAKEWIFDAAYCKPSVCNWLRINPCRSRQTFVGWIGCNAHIFAQAVTIIKGKWYGDRYVCYEEPWYVTQNYWESNKSILIGSISQYCINQTKTASIKFKPH